MSLEPNVCMQEVHFMGRESRAKGSVPCGARVIRDRTCSVKNDHTGLGRIFRMLGKSSAPR